MRNPRKTNISPVCIRGRELRVAVGRQINAGKALVVQSEGEWQRQGGNCIICVIADIRRPGTILPAICVMTVLPDAWRRGRRVSWRRARCGRSRGRRTCSRCRALHEVNEHILLRVAADDIPPVGPAADGRHPEGAAVVVVALVRPAAPIHRAGPVDRLAPARPCRQAARSRHC